MMTEAEKKLHIKRCKLIKVKLFEPDPSQVVFIQLHTARGTEPAGDAG